MRTHIYVCIYIEGYGLWVLQSIVYLWSFYDGFFVFQTRVQASTLSFPDIIAKLPQIGVRGLYRGSIPAILGQFSRSWMLGCLYISFLVCILHYPIICMADVFLLTCSHGLRTGIFEASKLVLINVAPNLPDIQVIF